MVAVSMLMGFTNQLCYRSRPPRCSFPCIFSQIYSHYHLFMFYTTYSGCWFQLLWKIWVRQLGWWHSQYDGKVIQNSMVPNHQPGSLSYVWTHVFHYGARSNGPTANSLRPCHVRHGHGTGWSSRCRSRRCNALGSSAPAPRPRSTWPGGVSSHKWNICRTMYL